jgi:light-regulated signal transduction histidine kinase (bacteriophytochrome)
LSSPAYDITSCEREPIHIPGAIQPHGVLLAVEPRTHRIVHVSENAAEVLGRDAHALLHEHLDSVFGGETAGAIESAIAGRDGVTPLRVEIGVHGEPRRFDAFAHRSGELIVVELEAMSDDDERVADSLLGHLHRVGERIQLAPTVDAVCALLAEEFGRLCGFDRTLVYRFDADWNGEVVAERRAPEQPAYLGLRFPAMDIPRQARELYRRQVLRAVPDARYAPVAVVPTVDPLTDKPLDLSRSLLRAISPTHLE